MQSTARSLAQRFRGKTLRYTTVSLIATAISQTLLYVTHGRLGWAGWTANVFAVCVSSVPSYYLNRTWVWSKRGRNALVSEVLPFWMVALAGLMLSTVLVAIVDSRSDADWVVNVANLAGFALLWVAKFLLLDAVLFKPHHVAA